MTTDCNTTKKKPVPYQLYPKTPTEKSTWECSRCRNSDVENTKDNGIACMKCTEVLPELNMTVNQRNYYVYRDRPYLCNTCQEKGYKVSNTNDYTCAVCHLSQGIGQIATTLRKGRPTPIKLKCKKCAICETPFTYSKELESLKPI